MVGKKAQPGFTGIAAPAQGGAVLLLPAPPPQRQGKGEGGSSATAPPHATATQTKLRHGTVYTTRGPPAGGAGKGARRRRAPAPFPGRSRREGPRDTSSQPPTGPGTWRRLPAALCLNLGPGHGSGASTPAASATTSRSPAARLPMQASRPSRAPPPFTSRQQKQHSAAKMAAAPLPPPSPRLEQERAGPRLRAYLRAEAVAALSLPSPPHPRHLVRAAAIGQQARGLSLGFRVNAPRLLVTPPQCVR